MAKLVNLTAHKNTAVRRRSKVMVAGIRNAANEAQRGLKGKMAGYCLVAWDESRSAYATWNGSRCLGQFPLPEFVRHELLRRENIGDAADLFHGEPPDEGA